MKRLQGPLLAGIVLIAIGVIGLLFAGASGWSGPDDTWWSWHRGPMMRGFGRHPMFGPWSGPGAGGQALPPLAGAKTIEVVATDFSFKSAEITIKAGEAVNVRFVNQGVTVHDLVVPSQGLVLLQCPRAPGGRHGRADHRHAIGCRHRGVPGVPPS